MANLQTLMRPLVTWSMTSHEQAVANARGASVECSRGRVEREEVAAYLGKQVGAVVGEQRGRRTWIAHSG
ncbi:hypothetical protein NOCA2120101 [metagenome]|uniref:Uncharacterized protein n=1 Tax=metagenome TaxID=256318 RepID=A0A2P2BWE1_9ZZZZ